MEFTVGMVSLGCSKNLVDSEEILGELAIRGGRAISDPSEAEVIIINTCGFIESAKTDSLNAVFEMARYKVDGACRLFVVCGCLSERYYNELQEELPEADLLWGVKDHRGLAEAIEQRLTGEISTPCSKAERLLATPPFRAYLRIADGCDNRCTYCAIPLIRGGRVSVPMEQLIEEARGLAERGVTELTVIAQDTSAYGTDLYGEPRLAELLTELSKIEKLHWIRLLYTYPNTVDKKLIDTINANPKLCNYIDMPIQHINPRLLGAMNRHGSAQHIREITDYIRKANPDFILRTTAIVGFPGETDEESEELMRFFREHPYDRLGAFTYSPEDGTPAAEMDCQIDEKLKQRRLDRLMRQQRNISFAANKARIGKVYEVLVEEVKGGVAYCRSYAEAAEVDGFIKVKLTEAEKQIADNGGYVGHYGFVEITGAEAYDLHAEWWPRR